MTCQSCGRDLLPGSLFCGMCGEYVPVPMGAKKANVFCRSFALLLDPLLGVFAWGLAIGVGAVISPDLGAVAAFLFPIAYGVWFLSLLNQGMTPGKRLMGLQVVNQFTGTKPGFAKMFVREVFGRMLSGLFLGIGYFWALWDPNGQAWHDKLASTVVVRIVQRGLVNM